MTVTDQDLDQFKAKVVKVARELAIENGLCDVVDQALQQMGLSSLDRGIRVKTGISVDIPMVMDDAVYKGMNKEELEKYIGDRLRVRLAGSQIVAELAGAGGAGLKFSGANTNYQYINLNNLQVQVLGVDEGDTRIGVAPSGYAWMYCSDGFTRPRVAHLVNTRESEIVSALCERMVARVATSPGPDNSGWHSPTIANGLMRFRWLNGLEYQLRRCACCETRAESRGLSVE